MRVFVIGKFGPYSSDHIQMSSDQSFRVARRSGALGGIHSGFQVVWLLVSNFHGGSSSIKGKHLQLPFQRNRRGAITLGFVTSLIVQLSRDREHSAILSERRSKLHPGVHLYILADSERPLENRHALIDHRQKECLGLRVQRWLQLHFRYGVDHQRYRLITLSARRIHMHIRRKPHFGS
jgi:hypothetical protein